MTSPKTMKRYARAHPNLTLAADWLAKSGLQSENGAFYSWYDCKKKEYSFIYPEATGHAISLLLLLYRYTRNRTYFDKAILAGDWLLEVQRDDGSFYCKCFSKENVSGDKDWDRSSYTFDAAICANGLLNLFKATSQKKYLIAAMKTGYWLTRQQDFDGSFVAVVCPDGKNEAYRWSRISSCHHLNMVSPLLKLYKILHEKTFLVSAEKLLKWGQNLKLSSGRFRISNESGETYAHAHNYAVEGMLDASEFFSDPILLKNAFSGATWLSAVQNNDGSLWSFYDSKKERIKASDATAQAVRIWLTFYENGATRFFRNIEKGLQFLAEMQCLCHDKRAHGGIFYGRLRESKINHVNSWATIFTIKALLQTKESRFIHQMRALPLESVLI